jgi:hypothetical protein
VARFAPYDKADDADNAGWISVLKRTLEHNTQAPVVAVSTVTGAAAGVVSLPFPVEQAPDLRVPVSGDLRGGMPERIGGNEWCRLIDDDIYRLHALGQGAAATTLRWTGVYLPPNPVLTVRARCAIEESLPVQATLSVVGANGTMLRFSNPLTVSLIAESLRPLKMGERAVVDLVPIRAMPAAA